MFIRIEKSSAVPISRQIADQVRALCLGRTLAPGSKLPSVRQLARDLAVNQNTILRVYERLTAEHLLERRHGDGTYIAASPPARQLEAERRQLGDELRQIVNRGRMLGLDPKAMREALDTALDSTQDEPPTPGAPTNAKERSR